MINGNMMDRLREAYADRLMCLKAAAEEVGEVMGKGSWKATFEAGQWLQVNARELATIAESIARVRAENEKVQKGV